MMNRISKLKSYVKLPGVISVGLHLLLFGALLTQIPVAMHTIAQEQGTVVQAVSVDQAAVEKTMMEIKQKRRARDYTLRSREQQLAQQVKNSKQTLQQERQQLAKLREQVKQEQIKQEELRARAKQQLAKINEEQKRAQANLKKLEQKKQQAAQQLAAQRETATAETTPASAQAAEIAKYSQLIKQAIAKNWLVPSGVDKELSCQLRIRLAPDGTVLKVQLIRSSNNRILDRSALSAVQKASPLPVPTNPKLFERFREIALTVRPEGFLS